MVKKTKTQWKSDYFANLSSKLAEYDKCFIVLVDNVRSKQMQQIRASLRDTACVVMGKNTMIRKVINLNKESKDILEKLLPCVNQNMGFVFTKADLSEVRKLIEANRVEAPAKAGTIAPCDVVIPKQNTGLGPEKTNFFQALSIQTKITRGTIEILNDVHLIHKGDKVGQSESALLSMLKIYPFTYGLVIRSVFENGSVYSPDVLDITPEIVLEKFSAGAQNVAALSLATNFTTCASVPHILATTLKKMIALSVATDYTPTEVEQIKEYLADPSKFASATVCAAPAGGAASDKKADDSKAAAKEEPADDSDSDSDVGMGLFD